MIYGSIYDLDPCNAIAEYTATAHGDIIEVIVYVAEIESPHKLDLKDFLSKDSILKRRIEKDIQEHPDFDEGWQVSRTVSKEFVGPF